VEVVEFPLVDLAVVLSLETGFELGSLECGSSLSGGTSFGFVEVGLVLFVDLVGVPSLETRFVLVFLECGSLLFVGTTFELASVECIPSLAVGFGFELPSAESDFILLTVEIGDDELVTWPSAACSSVFFWRGDVKSLS
jgi:hypothetical protein